MFIDECGFMLQPLVRRTWAPRGKTPVLKSWDRHDRLSVISAITLSPKQRRPGLYFHAQRQNVKAENCRWFLQQVRKAVSLASKPEHSIPM
ncbi:MAG TPA: transposase [Verrucomicrobiota bacterium]|nr:transposase [Verrucomicrobiota bacterium]